MSLKLAKLLRPAMNPFALLPSTELHSSGPNLGGVESLCASLTLIIVAGVGITVKIEHIIKKLIMYEIYY